MRSNDNIDKNAHLLETQQLHGAIQTTGTTNFPFRKNPLWLGISRAHMERTEPPGCLPLEMPEENIHNEDHVHRSRKEKVSEIANRELKSLTAREKNTKKSSH